MNLSEFKAWFSGFSENLDGLPTEKQWKRIKEKIGHIKDVPPVTEHVFHHDYYTPWRRYWYGGPIYNGLAAYGQNSVSTSMGTANNDAQTIQMQMALNQNMQQQAAGTQQQVTGNIATVNNVAFDSSSAFHELGRAEARSLSKDKTEE